MTSSDIEAWAREVCRRVASGERIEDRCVGANAAWIESDQAARTVPLTPNERRMAEDRCDCNWLYVVTDCNATPQLQEPIKDPARFPWHEVTKVQHYWLEVNAITRAMQVRENPSTYGDDE